MMRNLRSKHSVWSPMAIGFLGLVWAFGPPRAALGQRGARANDKNQEKPETPIPKVGNEPNKIPYTEDPNVPGLSRDERLKRQREYIRKKVAEAKAKRDAQRQATQKGARGASAKNTDKSNNKGSEKNSDRKKSSAERAKALAAARAAAAKKSKGKAGAALESDPLMAAIDLTRRFGRQRAPGTEPPKAGDGKENAEADADFLYVSLPQMTFYLSPASKVVEVGETFATECILSNVDRTSVDRIDLVINYSAEHFDPVAIHQDAIKDVLDGDPQWGIDRKRGEIVYRAKFLDPVRSIDVPTITIVWKALAPSNGVEITLASPRAASAAYFGDIRLTENVFGKEGLLTPALVRINPPKGAIPQAIHSIDDPLKFYASNAGDEFNGNARTPSLKIQYDRKRIYEEGEWVIFDFYLDNPDQASFDEVILHLRFDPDSIEFVDTDDHNLIRQGTNLLDGPFRDTWNWNILATNEIDAKRGILDYRMRTSEIGPRPSGIVARAVCRIKNLATDPLLTWVCTPEVQASGASSGVCILGVNLLGGFDPLHDAKLTQSFLNGELSVDSLVPAAEKADPSLYRFSKR